MAELPPNNAHYEKSMLAMFMATPSAREYVGKYMPSEDCFFYTEHKLVWRAIKNILERQEITFPDLVMVQGEMERSGNLDRLDEGILTLTDMALYADGCGWSFINAIPVGKELKRLAGLRKSVECNVKAVETLYNPENREVGDLLGEQINHLVEIASEEDQESQTMGDALDAFMDDWEDVNRGKVLPIVTTPWAEYNNLIGGGFYGPYLCYVGARPGMGKTTWALNAAKFAAENDRKVLFVSLEMSTQQVIGRIIASETGVSSNELNRKTFTARDEPEVVAAISRLSQLPLTINHKVAHNIDAISSLIRSTYYQYGVDIVFIDYVQLISGDGYNRNEEMTHISKTLANLTVEINAPIVILSQLSRNVESRADKRPIPSDLRDSGSLEQDANNITFLYRPAIYDKKLPDDKVELIVAKNREQKLGTVEVNFDGHSSRFYDLRPAQKQEQEQMF